MHKRSKVWALLGAAVLTVGTVGFAMAIELKDAHQGIVVGWDDNGDPFAEDSEGDFGVNPEDCDELDLSEGDIVFHFVQSGPGVAVNGTDPYGDDDLLLNTIDVDLTGADDVDGTTADSIQNSGNVDWFVWTSSAGGDVTLDTANSNVAGNDDTLRVSHICVGDEPEGESEPPTDEPSFEQSQEGETDEPTLPPTDEPSFEQSQEGETDEPSFEQSQEGDTDEPTEPNTSSIGGGTSSPADGAWLLVVALGVLLASIVVMTPARAKSRR